MLQICVLLEHIIMYHSGNLHNYIILFTFKFLVITIITELQTNFTKNFNNFHQYQKYPRLFAKIVINLGVKIKRTIKKSHLDFWNSSWR